jgi:hypothetical protein
MLGIYTAFGRTIDAMEYWHRRDGDVAGGRECASLELATEGQAQVPVTPDALFGLASLQCTQAEAATYFDRTERTIRRRLAQPGYREAWEMGRARGRVSFRRLGLRHASGTGPAAVAAWIHLSKFILGYSEKLLGEQPNVDWQAADTAGAKKRLFERIARIAERWHPGVPALNPPPTFL